MLWERVNIKWEAEKGCQHFFTMFAAPFLSGRQFVFLQRIMDKGNVSFLHLSEMCTKNIYSSILPFNVMLEPMK